eukprot:4135772-Pleurochrysis_carterae.AAC.1
MPDSIRFRRSMLRRSHARTHWLDALNGPSPPLHASRVACVSTSLSARAHSIGRTSVYPRSEKQLFTGPIATALAKTNDSASVS